MRALFRSVRALFAKSGESIPPKDRANEGSGTAAFEVIVRVPGMT